MNRHTIKNVSVFDFDGTIYDGDATLDFYKFILKKYPRLTVFLPQQVLALLRYKIGLIDVTKFKEMFLRPLSSLENADSETLLFWEKNESKIKPWFKDLKKPDDIIITASPEFLIGPVANKYGVALIGTIFDLKTGTIIGNNCRGEEKVSRLRNQLPDISIGALYTDDLKHDGPLASISNQTYLVTKDVIEPVNLGKV